MKKYLSSSVTGLIIFLLVTSVTPVLAQQMPKQMPLGAPKVINFKELANYELTHPVKKKAHFIEQGDDLEDKIKYKPRTAGSDAFNFNVKLPQVSSRSVSPSPNIVFNGPIDNSGIVPPDVQAAAGDTYVMATTNQEFDIYTKTGTLVSNLSVSTFFSTINVDVEFSDPHVVYDATYKRWIVVIDPVELSDFNDDGGWGIAVSETSDPTGSWYVYTYDAGISEAGGDLLDYPLLGYNKKWVVITGNLYTNTSVDAEIYVFNRAELYSGTLGTASSFTDANVFTWDPAQTFDTSEATEYMATDYNGDQNDTGYVQVGTITGTATAPIYTEGNILGVNSTWSEQEVDANQEGGATPITTDNTEINNAVYRNGELWFSHNVYLPTASPSYSGVDWWEVNPATPSVTQYGRIADPNGQIFYFYPGMCVDSAGDALIGYTSCSPSTYASAEYSYRAVTDAKNTMEGGYTYNPGLSSYDNSGSGRNRWGDFSYTFMDPVNNSFWTDQEYAYSGTNTWATALANISGTPCKDKPSAGAISSVVDTVCSGEDVILNLTGYTSNVVGLGFTWQQSLNGINGWVIVTGGTGDSTDTYTTAPLTSITYYRSIVSCLSAKLSDTSAPFKVVVPGIVSVSISNDTLCTPVNVILTATSIGSPVNWYNSNTSTTPIANGDVLNIYLTQDTTFYVNTGKLSHDSVGISDEDVGGGSYFNYTFDDGLLFNAINNFTLDSLYIYANSTGTVTVALVDNDNGTTVGTATITINANEENNKTVVHTDFSCIAGANYDITASGTTVSALFRTSSGAVYPYTVPGVVSINGPNNGAAAHYYFFYDWHISTGCSSQRIPVPVNFHGLPVVAKASSDTLCSGKNDSVLLSASGATSYQWSPVNTTDSSVYVKPSVTTTYIVTGTNSAGCGGTAQVVVNVVNCTSGVNTINDNSPSIEVYPNPTTGQFDITMNNLPNQVYVISLYNILGQKIIEKQAEINSSYYTMPMDASELLAGLYFVRVTAGNNEWTQHITKL
jgi:hypothetical protein